MNLQIRRLKIIIPMAIPITSVTFAITCLFCLGCTPERDTRVKNAQQKVKSTIAIGDDIFAAKEKLVEQGFSIEYGPEFPTKNKDYYLMIVDYGARPNGVEVFKYTIGVEDDGRPIAGVIKADAQKRITSIE